MQVIDRYELVEEIARGAAGVVYRARDPKLQRDVAVKLLLNTEGATEDQRRRFAREGRALARLNHPHVLRVHTAAVQEATPYLVLDLVEGETLADRVGREGPLPVEEAARIVRKLAEGLAHCHAEGVLHRDLKPGNVLLAGGEPLLADFGLAKDLQRLGQTDSITKSGTYMGTPGFWSPEQAAGNAAKVDERTDVFSLGATLYALLTGKPPFTGQTLMELAVATRERPAPSVTLLRPEAPPELDRIVQGCLAKAPEDRYPSAAALAEDLGRFLGGSKVSGAHGAARVRRGPWLAAGAALVLVAGAVGFAMRGEPAPAPTAVAPTARPSTPVASAAPTPRWGWRLPVGERFELTLSADVGRGEKHQMRYALLLRVTEALSGGRIRCQGTLRRIWGVAHGGDTLLPFDTDRPLDRHGTAVQVVLANLFGLVGKQVEVVLGPRYADMAVSGLGGPVQLQRGYAFDANQTLRRILGEALGVLPQGPVRASWTETLPLELDTSDEAVYAGSGVLRGRREGQRVTVEIEGSGLRATEAAAGQGITGLLRFRRGGELTLEEGWVSRATSREEILFQRASGDALSVFAVCEARVVRLRR